MEYRKPQIIGLINGVRDNGSKWASDLLNMDRCDCPFPAFAG